jgi:hypothetical protein
MEIRVMCYKFEMAKTTEQWLLFEYVGLHAVIQAIQNEGTSGESA